MNEMNFRTKLLTHPQLLDDEMLAFLEDNPEKKQTVQSIREFDSQIAEALDIGVPEGLHARILLNQSYQENLNSESLQQNSGSPLSEKVVDIAGSDKSGLAKASSWLTGNGFMGWPLGIAASLLVVTLTLGLWQNSQQAHITKGVDIVNHVIEHIEHDPSLMTAVKLPSSEQELQELFASVGAQLSKPVEGMSYAGICDVEGQDGLHIVMQENGSPVTIIVMPGQQVAAMEAFEASGYQGELVPVKGGVVAIVADTMEQVALAQIRFFKAVKFV